ncbi:MAG: glutathione S-transferase [Magnetococcales bacterium]|nr:glutathione S-transferase [Magnetococcales bacterium]
MNSPYPILYSFRRCPYAMRARLAIYKSGTVCEIREVVLKDKPKEMLEISPKGTVPVLQKKDGTVIDESLDIMLWAMQLNDPDGWLEPGLAQMQHLIDDNDNNFKIHLDRYKYPNRYENVDLLEHRQQAEAFIAQLDNRLQKTGYLFGNRACLADFAILPFVRQFSFVDKAWFDSRDYKALQRWLAEFLNSQLFKAIMPKYPKWNTDDAITIFADKKL